MNRMTRILCIGSAALFAAASFSACGDDTKPAATDTIGGDSAIGSDTATGTDTTTTTDVAAPNDTTSTTGSCTEAELATFETCGDNCAQDQQCFAGCVNAMSAKCGLAFDALSACIQTAQCTQANFAECVSTNCLAEYEDFYGPLPEPTSCNPVTSAECEAGETCGYVSQDFDVGCGPAGTAELGAACGGEVGCKAGACLGDGTANVCTAFCNASNNTCPNNAPCNVRVQGSDFSHCGTPPDGCDIFAQDCANNRGCFPVNAAGDTTCASTSGKAEGAVCEAINDCGAGLICIGSGATGICRTVCNLETTPEACTTGACSAAGFSNNVGACIPN